MYDSPLLDRVTPLIEVPDNKGGSGGDASGSGSIADAGIVLLSVSGTDRTGLLAELTELLADYRAQILDIGQAIVHEQLVLSLLVRFDRHKADSLVTLVALAERRGVTLSHTPVPEAAYGQWVRQQGQPRYILTLLADGLRADQMAAVSRVIRDHGLNVYDIARLSRRLELTDLESPTRVSIEMTLRGRIADERALKMDLLGASADHDIDCSVQLDSVYRRNRRLVVFDMDSTLIQVEVIDELARLHGVYDQVAQITARAMAGELDFQESFRARVALLAGLPEAALRQVAEAVPLSDGAERLIRALRHFGYTTAILSGGFQYVGDVLQQRLGVDHVHANTLEFRDGVATGGVQGPIVDAAAKARILGELCAAEGISPQQAIALGDGANDLPMLATAGLGIAFHAKPMVAETAKHAISRFGLDSVLYLLGFSEWELGVIAQDQSAVEKS